MNTLGTKSCLLSLSQCTLHAAVKSFGNFLTVVAPVDFDGLFSLFRFQGVDPGKLDQHCQYREEQRPAERFRTSHAEPVSAIPDFVK